jgi:transcription termination factor Rho
MRLDLRPDTREALRRLGPRTTSRRPGRDDPRRGGGPQSRRPEHLERRPREESRQREDPRLRGDGPGHQDLRGRPDLRGRRTRDPRREQGRKRDLLEGLRLLHRGVSIDPFERLVLETTPDQYSTRVIDLIAPIGKGQRCLITSPPKAGKTMLLMAVAQAVITNHPEVEVVVLLVDERPEEVTHFRRGVACEVVASSNDMTPETHVRTTEETVIRVAESVTEGKDVVLLLDSITRLARAYNVFSDGTGRTLSGGLDASTMYGPRRIFGAARKIENGGSLTILGTALVDTGSRMDEVIFQEFKGTGNTEVVLSRDLANKRIFPSVDILASGSRKEEKLYPFDTVSRLHLLRRFLADRKPEEAMLGLIKMLERYRTNKELLRALGN